jgi:uncharacterized membrane protein required for colicin V production
MIIDIIFAAILGYGIYIGYSNGIIKTIFTILSIALGVLVTAHFYEQVTDLMKTLFNYHNPIMMFAGMFTTFFVTMLFLRLIGRQLENILKSANINFINQILGGLVMSALFTIVYSLIISFMVQASLLKEQVDDSKTYVVLEQVPDQAKVVWSKVSPKVSELWQEIAKTLDDLGGRADDIHIEDLLHDDDDETTTIKDYPDDDDSLD